MTLYCLIGVALFALPTRRKSNLLEKVHCFLLAKDEVAFEARISEMITEDYKNAQAYADLVLGWCGSHVPVFLVVDNVDQLEDSETQSTIFADSIAIASRIGAPPCGITPRVHLRGTSTFAGVRCL